MQEYLDSMTGSGYSLKVSLALSAAGFLIIAGLILDVILLSKLRRDPPDSPSLDKRLKSRPWIAKDGLCVFLLMFSAVLVGLTLGEAAFLFQLTAMVFIFIRMRALNISSAQAFGIKPREIHLNIKQGAFCYIAALPVVIFYALIYTSFLETMNFEMDHQEPIKILLDPSVAKHTKIALVFLAVVIAPFIEEIIFRGVMLPALSKHVSSISAIFILSLVFAAMHCHVATFVPLFVISLAFSLGYLYSGSLLVPVIMHVLFNGINLLFLYFLKDVPELL